MAVHSGGAPFYSHNYDHRLSLTSHTSCLAPSASEANGRRDARAEAKAASSGAKHWPPSKRAGGVTLSDEEAAARVAAVRAQMGPVELAAKAELASKLQQQHVMLAN